MTALEKEREAMAQDLAGIAVTYWDGLYAEDLLSKFFPVQSCAVMELAS